MRCLVVLMLSLLLVVGPLAVQGSQVQGQTENLDSSAEGAGAGQASGGCGGVTLGSSSSDGTAEESDPDFEALVDEARYRTEELNAEQAGDGSEGQAAGGTVGSVNVCTDSGLGPMECDIFEDGQIYCTSEDCKNLIGPCTLGTDGVPVCP